MEKTHSNDEICTTAQVLDEIEKAIARSSVRGLAREKGLPAPQISATRKGKAPISEIMAKAFGFRRQVYTEVRFIRLKRDR